uniref:NADH:ubiquinone reductase (H(+)-translocating) n=1 Tax=Hydra oligactis TaxID=6088 RepID=A9YMB8_HYDOL|nr:NADH dehydrogenase subunit 2 [Hydra oligactis]ABW76612.1 NADH dehydrogenase subunit 2 [Hydra oligactis]
MIFNYNNLLIFTFIVFIILNLYLNKNSFIFLLLIIFIIILSQFLKLDFFLYISIILFIIIINNLKIELENLVLYSFILLSIIVIIFSNNLILLYLSVEIQTFTLLILIGSNRNNIKSLEASLKYFILSSISSGFFLLGLTYLFKTSLLLDLNLYNFILNNSVSFYSFSYIILILSLFFKLGLAPFHYWIADIYEGSDLKLILLLSSLCKLSIFIILLKFNNHFEIFMILGALSIIIGTIAGFNQTKIKRLIAYSGISNFGFIIISLSLNNIIGIETCLLYLFIYLFTNLFIIIILIVYNFNIEFIIELSGYLMNNKILTIALIIMIFSIAGIPPLLGFLSKFIIISTLINYNYILIGCTCLFITSIGIGFYLRIVKILLFQNNNFYISWNNIISINKNNLYLNSIYLGFIIYYTIFYLFNPKFFISSISILLNF